MQFRFIFDGIPNTFFGKIMKENIKNKNHCLQREKAQNKIPVVMNKKLPH
jgi:hypothetical protein